MSCNIVNKEGEPVYYSRCCTTVNIFFDTLRTIQALLAAYQGYSKSIFLSNKSADEEKKHKVALISHTAYLLND